MSTVDGAIDCQPITYERCYTGEALDADGSCVSERCEIESGKQGLEWECPSALHTVVYTPYRIRSYRSLPYIMPLPFCI